VKDKIKKVYNTMPDRTIKGCPDSMTVIECEDKTVVLLPDSFIGACIRNNLSMR